MNGVAIFRALAAPASRIASILAGCFYQFQIGFSQRGDLLVDA